MDDSRAVTLKTTVGPVRVCYEDGEIDVEQIEIDGENRPLIWNDEFFNVLAYTVLFQSEDGWSLRRYHSDPSCPVVRWPGYGEVTPEERLAVCSAIEAAFTAFLAEHPHWVLEERMAEAVDQIQTASRTLAKYETEKKATRLRLLEWQTKFRAVQAEMEAESVLGGEAGAGSAAMEALANGNG